MSKTRLTFEMKRSFISARNQILQHAVRYDVKCVEKVPFHKSGHILQDIVCMTLSYNFEYDVEHCMW